MKYINRLDTVGFEVELTGDKDIDARKVLDSEFGQMLEVTIRHPMNLKKHKANVPITVLCIAGEAVFCAGDDLEDCQKLTPGTLISLDANIPHEVNTTSYARVLVTKFN